MLVLQINAEAATWLQNKRFGVQNFMKARMVLFKKEQPEYKVLLCSGKKSVSKATV